MTGEDESKSVGAMEFLRELVKFPLYRIIFPLCVGATASLLLYRKVLALFPDFQLVAADLLARVTNFPTLITTLAVTLLLLLGELLCFTGELIINPLFRYLPFVQGPMMERVTPFTSSTIGFSDFDDLLKLGKEIALDMSEVHFNISRVFSGVMVALLAYAMLEPKNHILSISSIPFSMIILWICSRKHAKWWSGFLQIGSVIAPLILSQLPFLRSSVVDGMIAACIIISLFASVNYRCHANKLVYYNRTRSIS